jgi:hypothetical protein
VLLFFRIAESSGVSIRNQKQPGEDIMKSFIAIALATVGVFAFATRADDAADTRGCRSGGAGGPSIELAFLDTKPFKQLVQHDTFFRGRDINLESRAMPVFGLSGFRQNRYGIRFGGGVWLGYKIFESAAYTTIDSAGTAHDSVAQLLVMPAYAGFLLEKVIYFGQVGFHGGVMLGGGAYVVHRSTADASDPTDVCGSDSAAGVNGWGAAGFGIMDLDAGATIRLAPWFSVALDGVLGMTYSGDGLMAGYGDFVSVNPGIRLRLLVGKL